ncbi:hypothetical protein CHS0354_023840 [Potamilus streckersoni]|uniref:N-acetyl-alpha-D-glucosaminyl L-malate synthase BshA n=1 Tax=Potamilus streckersoni TaxID=2493646 RepID=A0AAE0VMM7_9BIVA|nr:hypothetical protein CHS0354_023840 [Potamilus streckersoni]
MKIGITCYPTYGGSGVIATELGKGLAGRGHQVSISDYPLFEYPPYSISLAAKMADVMLTEKLDIMHVHYAIPHAISAYLANSILGGKGKKHVPIVTTLHGTDITIVGKDPMMMDAVRLGINNSNAVTSVSHFLKNETELHFSPTLPIQVIYNFVNHDVFKKIHDDKFRNVFAKPNEKILIHISNFRPVKRTEDVIAVFNLVQKELPVKLLLVGDGPDRPTLEMKCRELCICDKVKFLGRHPSITPLLSVADVMIMPSLTESFGLAALEAMSCETPVIASDVGGLRELIEDRTNGFLCKTMDVETMARRGTELLSDEDMLMRFKRSARVRAEEFNIEKALNEYEQIYWALLKRKG